jgi:ribonuclease HI
MSKLSCYTDGSQIFTEHGTVRQGWGIVARHISGQTVEINGFVDHDHRHKNNKGYFELLAFYHAVLHAEKNGLLTEDVSFYTDCSWVAYAGYHLVKENKSPHRSAIFKRLKKFQKLFCAEDKHAVMKLIRWLALAQVNWVKAHSNIIDNCRADYLARTAVRGKKTESFTKWILHGFSQRDSKNQQMCHWFPAFSRMLEIE